MRTILELWKTEPMQATGILGEIYALIHELQPFDALEAHHRCESLAWLRETDDVFRRVKPRTPSPHLVAYFLLRDDRDGSVLLVDHIKAGLWALGSKPRLTKSVLPQRASRHPTSA